MPAIIERYTLHDVVVIGESSVLVSVRCARDGEENKHYLLTNIIVSLLSGLHATLTLVSLQSPILLALRLIYDWSHARADTKLQHEAAQCALAINASPAMTLDDDLLGTSECAELATNDDHPYPAVDLQHEKTSLHVCTREADALSFLSLRSPRVEYAGASGTTSVDVGILHVAIVRHALRAKDR